MLDRALELVLPWPDKGLSPNGSKLHWTKVARLTKQARTTAALLAYEAGWKDAPLPEGSLHLWIDFYQAPSRTLPDDDNMLRRFKPYRDGIAQILGIDDKRFISHPRVHDERRPGGQVVVRIQPDVEQGAHND